MTNSDLCFDVWTIRKVANNDFGREYWHFDDFVNYRPDDCTVEPTDEKNDEEYLTDRDNPKNWRDYYYKHKNVIDDFWNPYWNSKS